jgi:hypothetical protein
MTSDPRAPLGDELRVPCAWCGETVKVLPVDGNRQRLRLEPHEDIYPTRGCEGGNRIFETNYRVFEPRKPVKGWHPRQGTSF